MKLIKRTEKVDVLQSTPKVQEDVQDIQNDENNARRDRFYKCLSSFLSIRIIVVSLVLTQVVLACFFIWLTSFLSGRASIAKTSALLLSGHTDRVTEYVQERLHIDRVCVNEILFGWDNEVINPDNVQTVLFGKTKVFERTLGTVAFAYNGTQSIYYGTERTENPNGTISYLIYEQLEGNPDLHFYSVSDPERGTYNSSLPVRVLPNYNVLSRDWYQVGMTIEGEEGLWGKVYMTLQSEFLSIYYIKPIYGMTNGTRTRIGVAKINSSLRNFNGFLSHLELPGSGFITIAEENGNLIASSYISDEIVSSTSRVKVYDIKDGRVGIITTKIREFLGGSLAINKEVVDLIDVDGKRLVVSITPFRFDNIRWTLILVVSVRDVMWSMYQSTFIILGIALFLVVLSIMLSAVSGYVLSIPFITLKREFEKIAEMDFEGVKALSSPVFELYHIYNTFNDMVRWLKEYKMYLPASVLFPGKDQDERDEAEDDKTDSTTARSHQKRSNKVTDYSSDPSVGSIEKKKHKFDVGLSSKLITVLSIEIDGHRDEDISSNICSSYLDRVSNSAFIGRGNMQVIDPFKYILSWNTTIHCIDHHSKACKTALILLKSLRDVDENAKVSIGISSGPAQVGITGTKNQRIYSILGECKSRAKKLQLYAKTTGCGVLFDTSIPESAIYHSYVYRPIDFVNYEPQSAPIIAYELLRSKDLQSDEWMYEMEQKQSNELYESMIIGVKLLLSDKNLEKAVDMFNQYLDKQDTEERASYFLAMTKQRLEQGRMVPPKYLGFSISAPDCSVVEYKEW